MWVPASDTNRYIPNDSKPTRSVRLGDTARRTIQAICGVAISHQLSFVGCPTATARAALLATPDASRSTGATHQPLVSRSSAIAAGTLSSATGCSLVNPLSANWTCILIVPLGHATELGIVERCTSKQSCRQGFVLVRCLFGLIVDSHDGCSLSGPRRPMAPHSRPTVGR